jgi:ATP-binding cassette, subfamily G (WHITE), member 2, SNQ2
VAEKNREDMELYHSEYVSSTDKKNEYRRSVLMEHAKHVREGSPYVVSLPMQVCVHLPHCTRMEVRGLMDSRQARALMVRRWQIIKGQWATVVLDMAAFLVQAIIMGTVFFRLENTTATFFSRGGVLFLCVAHLMLMFFYSSFSYSP